MSVETVEELPIPCSGSGILGENDNVYATQSPAPNAKTFPSDTPDSVAGHSGRQLLARDGKADTRSISVAVPIQDGEITVGRAPGGGKYALKLVRFQQSRVATECVGL